MRIKGVDFQPNIEIVVIPRPTTIVDGKQVQNYVTFRCQAVNSYDEFLKLCPEPQPPNVIKKGGMQSKDFKDEGYLKKLETHSERRFHWMIIESLKATEGLEWEKVNALDPATWGLYYDELRDAGFSEYEIGRIRKGVLAANCLDDDRLNEARQAFLESQAEAPQG